MRGRTSRTFKEQLGLSYLCHRHIKCNVLMHSKNKRGLFTGSDRLFSILFLFARNKNWSVDLERKDWTTFGKRRCHRGACSQASHGGEGNLAAPGEAVPTLTRPDSLGLWYQMNAWIHRCHASLPVMARNSQCCVLSACIQSWCVQYVFMCVEIRHWGWMLSADGANSTTGIRDS